MKRILFSMVYIYLLSAAFVAAGVSAATYDSETALRLAAAHDQQGIVKSLLEMGVDVNAKESTTGGTALIFASMYGHTEVVKLLLEKGAEVDAKTNDGTTALIWAAGEGNAEIVKLLLDKGADINAQNTDGFTALRHAAWQGHVEVVNLLLEKGTDVNAKRTTDGATALMMAAQNGHMEFVKLLLEKGADVNVKTTNGVTALDVAKTAGHTDIVQILKKASTKRPEAAVSDKNAQAIKTGCTAAPQAARDSTTWMPGTEASVGYIRVQFKDETQLGHGTGFLIASNLIVTNLHVVSGANSAEITFPSGLSLPITGIVAEDAENDLVILTITPTGTEPPPLALAPVPAQVGDRLVIYGYPMGTTSQKMSDGNVTCIGPSLGMPLAIITSAPLTHGFSGGPAFNSQHQVVGVVQSREPAMVFKGKDIWNKMGRVVPASCITALAVGPSRSLREWTKARGTIGAADAEAKLGDQDTDHGDLDKAVQHFQKAAKLDPNNYKAWLEIGIIFHSMGRNDQAMDALHKAIALKPQFPEALCIMGDSFRRQQRYPEAVDTFEKCLQMYPNCDRYLCFLGLTYVETGQSEKAREQYQVLKPINPEAAEYLLGFIQQMDAASPPTIRGKGRGTKDKNAQLIIAAYDGNLTAVHTLLANGTEVNVKDTDGVTALMVAAQQDHKDVVKLLLENGADVNVKRTTNGMTALIGAAYNSHIEIVKLLLEKGAEVNAKDNDGATALRIAAQKGYTEVVKLLLENSADVNVRVTTDGTTALMAAAQNSHTDIVRLFLKNGADVNAKATTNGVTALILSAQEGHTEIVKLLLENSADFNVKTTDTGATALMIASEKGHTDIVKILLEKGADVNVKTNDGKWTALGVAKQNGRTDIVQLLKKAGANDVEKQSESVTVKATGNEEKVYHFHPKEECPVPSNNIEVIGAGQKGNNIRFLAGGNIAMIGNTLYPDALGSTEIRIVRDPNFEFTGFAGLRFNSNCVLNIWKDGTIELDKTDISAQDDFGNSYISRKRTVEGKEVIIMVSVTANPADTVETSAAPEATKQIVNGDSRIAFVRVKDTQPPAKEDLSYTDTQLLKAAKEGDLQGVQIFLRLTNVDIKDSNGTTPLMVGAYNGRSEIVEFLLENGADVNAKTKSGATAFDMAVQNGHKDIAKMLEKPRTKKFWMDLRRMNDELIQAAKDGDLQAVKTALAEGANINVKTEDIGWTSLMYAAEKGHTEIVRILLNNGADVGIRSKVLGDTALVFAAERGHTETVKLLLEKGADINAKDDYNSTALIKAAEKGRMEVVKLLLEKGADINVRDTCLGTTALIEAAANGNTEIVQLLLEKGAEDKTKTIYGVTALSSARKNGHTDIVQLLEKAGAKESETAVSDKNLEKVETKKIDTSASDMNAQLILAAINGDLSVVQTALANGADVNARDKNGFPILMLAAGDGRTEVVKLLLEKGADTNAKATETGATALLIASGRGHTEVVKLLLEKGADVTAKATIDNVEWTALKMANVMRRTDIVQLLEKAGAKD